MADDKVKYVIIQTNTYEIGIKFTYGEYIDCLLARLGLHKVKDIVSSTFVDLITSIGIDINSGHLDEDYSRSFDEDNFVSLKRAI